jgi:hypothetical protein
MQGGILVILLNGWLVDLDALGLNDGTDLEKSASSARGYTL